MAIVQSLASLAGRAIGAKIVRPQNLSYVLEEVYLKRFLTHFEIDCVFDVGANAGQYGTLLRRAGFKGHIVSFEPIPEMVRVLQRKSKRDPKWHVEPVALSATAGEASFNVTASSQFSSLLAPKNDEYGAIGNANVVTRSIPVVTSTLKSEYLKYKAKLGFARPFLKMDTQGNDVAVVRSAGETIDAFAGLQSELAVKRLYENTPHFDEAISFYRTKGFELSTFVTNNAWWHFPQLVEVDCIMFRPSALRS